MSMPIFFYFAVMGSTLVALLFVADATLEKHEPLWFNSEFTGLPSRGALGCKISPQIQCRTGCRTR
jgi:hypothetical protein